ncbi:MAG: hypothetical protein ACT4OX_07885, partial [Actinomycetota bacterium]
IYLGLGITACAAAGLYVALLLRPLRTHSPAETRGRAPTRERSVQTTGAGDRAASGARFTRRITPQ